MHNASEHRVEEGKSMMLSKFRYYWLTSVLSIGTIGLGTVWALAQPPTRTPEVTEVQGKVTELTNNAHNDPDGWKLDNGQIVHVPPHAFADLNAQVKAVHRCWSRVARWRLAGRLLKG